MAAVAGASATFVRVAALLVVASRAAVHSACARSAALLHSPATPRFSAASNAATTVRCYLAQIRSVRCHVRPPLSAPWRLAPTRLPRWPSARVPPQGLLTRRRCVLARRHPPRSRVALTRRRAQRKRSTDPLRSAILALETALGAHSALGVPVTASRSLQARIAAGEVTTRRERL